MAKAEKTLRERAVGLLSRREHSRAELKRKLAPHAESESELDALLDELSERRWQSDERFAEAFSESRSTRYGRRRIEQELRHKGVDNDTIRATLAGRDDAGLALSLWRRKFGALPATPQERARQMRFLASRGFGMDIIRKVLSGDGVPDDEFPPDDA
ncbi:recombination regulator RecX [Paludibacterium paludis]|uniref:Regulatory protein RecX n=1 Tax=Paludibacterium paludis TaxID=1225769 RepID=A0A918P4R3_9NEIS|nr:recombination regulator RecX [Paludibacterium paludis]GGY19079.1 hypothetical protein GCM10011289_23130 [Paludibacterium paludis]